MSEDKVRRYDVIKPKLMNKINVILCGIMKYNKLLNGIITGFSPERETLYL